MIAANETLDRRGAEAGLVNYHLAVQEAVKIGLGLKTRPTPKEMTPLAEPWRPLRGAAAHLWWSYYRAVKKREGVIGAQQRPKPRQ